MTTLKLSKKDLVSLEDITKLDIETILNLSDMIRTKHKNGELFVPLLGKSLAMIFRKPSTRTRVSFEIGMFQLGGAALYLSPNDIQLGRGETVADTAKVLSRYVSGIMIRTFAHSEVIELAENASIPVINGLTDFSHPCQIIADMLTIKDKKKALRGITVAYIGDGNNVCNSWMFGAPKMEMNLRVASPKGYEPVDAVAKKAGELAKAGRTQLVITNSPQDAAKDADVIYTDVWTSMGQEAETQKRLKDFEGFQINQALVKLAKKDCLVMHCLPAHRGEEITAEVIDGPNSVVFDEAENRLHAQKGILALLMQNK
jgi:ornithine carbamoyltransferase